MHPVFFPAWCNRATIGDIPGLIGAVNATVLFLLDYTYEADPGRPTREEIADGVHWNLWGVRLYPFNVLTEGTRVILVDRFPPRSKTGRITWEIRAIPFVSGTYRTKDHAAQQIASALGLTQAEVKNHEYTQRGPATGYFIAFRYEPVRPLGLSAPPDMPRFQPNGWLKIEDEACLERWGITRRGAVEEEEREGEYWTLEELEGKTLTELRAIAKAYNITTKGASRADLIDTIFSPDEEE